MQRGEQERSRKGWRQQGWQLCMNVKRQPLRLILVVQNPELIPALLGYLEPRNQNLKVEENEGVVVIESGPGRIVNQNAIQSVLRGVVFLGVGHNS
jgi:hypothetical protein